MCWTGNVKIAEQDFYVYKLGYVSDKGFRSLYQNFIYIPGVINKNVKMIPFIHNYNIYKLMKEQYGEIFEGSYTSMSYSDLGLYSRIIYLGKIVQYIRLNNIYSIATFIIPKGSEYYENRDGEIVSSNIIYTGKHLKL